MKTIDWNNIKFRASSWGNLLTEAQSKADRDAGILGATCQKELIKIYCQEVYNRKKDITTKQMDKGIQCEEEGITMYSRVEKKLYYKNDERLENDFFTGHPDVFSGESILKADTVDDIKCSWELETFMPKLLEDVDKAYEAQLNVYFDLTGAKSGSIVYALVSAPLGIVMEEQKRLLYKMDVISEESPAFIKAANELEKLMTFEDIDIRERIIKKTVYRNDELIAKMKSKVPVFRQWLKDFHQKHMNQYPK